MIASMLAAIARGRPDCAIAWLHTLTVTYRIRQSGILILPALLGACAAARPASCLPPVQPDEVSWLVDQGWHTEIGLPARQIRGPLSVFRSFFPGAKVLMFGFGKRTFITARVESFSELLLGPVPGPGTIQVIGLRVDPSEAYRPGQVIRLSLLPSQEDRLSAFVWDQIGKTKGGQPRLISPGLFPGSLFYASSSGYSLAYTCNTWSAAALRAAGLRINPAGVILPNGLLDQTARLADACLMPERQPH